MDSGIRSCPSGHNEAMGNKDDLNDLLFDWAVYLSVCLTVESQEREVLGDEKFCLLTAVLAPVTMTGGVLGGQAWPR